MKHVAMTMSVLVGSLILAGCGVSQPSSARSGTSSASSATGTPSSSVTPTSTVDTQSLSPSTAPSSASPSTTANPSPSPSVSMARIHYTPAQQSKIFEVGKSAGFGYAFVPQDGFNTHFTSVTVYKTSTAPPHQVLEVSYNNIVVQESRSASAFMGGGDKQSSKVTFTIPGTGSNSPETGTWTEVHGSQGSGNRGVLQFTIDGVTIQVGSSTLSRSSLVRIAGLFAQI